MSSKRQAPTSQPTASSPAPWLLPAKIAQRPSQREAVRIANGANPVRERMNAIALTIGTVVPVGALLLIAARGCA